MVRMFLTETYNIYDCIKYDNAISSDYNNIWGTSSYGAITRQTDYSAYSRQGTTNVSSLGTSIGAYDSFIIEFDYYKENGNNSDTIILFRDSTQSTNVRTLTNNDVGGVIGEWEHIQLNIDNINNTVTVTNTTTGYTQTLSSTDTVYYFRWALYGATTAIRFKNFKIYPV